MPNLKLIYDTLMVSVNPFTVLSLKGKDKRKVVTFKNGLKFCLTWPQFRVFRDNYSALGRYNIIQEDADSFKVSDARSEVLCSWVLLPKMFDLMQDYGIHEEQGIYHLKNEKVEMYGSLAMLSCIQELKTGEYNYDYKGKVVLDIGGFEGESAIYFWLRGAKKVVIYEPVDSHVLFIKKNIRLNNIEAEIHPSGIGSKDGSQIVEYETTDPGFGILCKGSKRMEIRTSEISSVLEKSRADIVKLDCEGAEISLLDVQEELLQKAEYYIIEVHSTEIRTKILEKFLSAKFVLEKETPKANQFSVLALKRA